MKRILTVRRVSFAAALLALAGGAAFAQNFPAPGQSIALPSPPAQQEQQPSPQANFPAPGQSFAAPPAQGGFQAAPGGFPGAGPAAQPPAKCQEIEALHKDRESRGATIQAGMQRKAPPGELCPLIRRYADAEAKFIKFIEGNAKTCGFPSEIIPQLKEGHKRTLQGRTNICNAAAGPPPPKPPTLGEALGAARVPDASNTRTGRGGAFDTLSGNPIAR